MCMHVTGIHDTAKPHGHFPWEKHGDTPEDRPNVEIGNPPKGKACDESVEKNVNINRNEGARAIGQGEDHNEQTKKMDVGERFHNDLGHKHECTQHGEHRHIADAEMLVSLRMGSVSKEHFILYVRGRTRRHPSGWQSLHRNPHAPRPW